MPGVSSFNTRTGAVTLLSADVTTALGFTPTNAAVVPDAAPGAGQILVGNAGGTAYAKQSLSGAITITSAGVASLGFPILAPDGSQAAPSYAFSGAASTGIFCNDDSTGQVGISSAGNHVVTINNGTGIRIKGDSAAQNLGWCSSGPNTAFDTVMSRAAAGVIKLDQSTGGHQTWMQQLAGEAALAANFTEAAGVLTATNLSRTLIAGRSYRIEGILQVSNSTAAEGSQFDFNGGTATATTFFVAFSNVGSVVAGTVTSTSLAGVMNYTTNTGTDYIYIRGFIKVNAGGTLTLRAAENTSAVGTMTLGAGSWLAFYDTNPL